MASEKFCVQLDFTWNYRKIVNHVLFSTIIGVVHLILTTWGLTETILELIHEQEPVEMSKVIYIASHFLFQVFLVSTLLIGIHKNIGVLLIPWLISTALLFTLATLYTLLQMTRERYFWNSFTNVILSGIFWLSWLTMFNLFGKMKSRKNVHYEKLPTSDIEISK